MHDPPSSRARCLSSVQCANRARWTLPAPALLDEHRWQSDPVPWSVSLGGADSPCSRRTDSIYDSDSDLWKLRREAEAEWSQSSTST